MAYGYGYEYISDMLFIHKLVCPEHVCRKQWIVGQSSPLKEWVRKCHKSSNWTLMTDHRQWKDMLSSFILWLCPPLVSSLSSLGNILSALLGISLTMRDYDSTNAPLKQLYSRYGGNVTESEKDVKEIKMQRNQMKERWKSYMTRSAEEKQAVRKHRLKQNGKFQTKQLQLLISINW